MACFLQTDTEKEAGDVVAKFDDLAQNPNKLKVPAWTLCIPPCA
jgi:hypothetical protein